MIQKTIISACAQMLSMFALPASHAADPFPVKPIQVVIPFAPGDTDNMLRPFLDKMGEFLGQSVIMTYKAGAGGGIGAGSVASSPPDGYTLVGTSQGSIVVVPTFNNAIKYSTESFAPIASISEGGFILVVKADSQWKTMQELIEYSKKNPKKINYTTSGAMGVTHLIAEIFANEAGIQWTHIPEKGSGPAVTALLGGHVQLSSAAIGPAMAHVRAGTLRALAVFSDKRLKAFPDVPTLKELGYKVEARALYGILAPKDTPKAVVDAIFLAAKKAGEKYQMQISDSLTAMGAQPALLDPKEYAAYVADQKAMFTKAKQTLKLSE
jgi:tripartite-type tricarboxylate transporter receptor subunit TctC